MAQLQEIRTNVQANWPSGYHSSHLTDSKTDALINETQRWICRGVLVLPDRKIQHNFSWLKQEVERSTVDRQRCYSLPTAGDSNWTEINSGVVRRFKSEITLELVTHDNYRIPLTKTHKEAIENTRDFVRITGYGIPECYCIDEDYIWLYKLPEHDFNNGQAWTMNFEFYGFLADLVENNDTNWITNYYPEILERGATALGFHYGLDTDQFLYWENLKNELFLEMVSEDQDKELRNIEEGMRPASGQELGGHKVRGELYQSPDWYSS